MESFISDLGSSPVPRNKCAVPPAPLSPLVSAELVAFVNSQADGCRQGKILSSSDSCKQYCQWSNEHSPSTPLRVSPLLAHAAANAATPLATPFTPSVFFSRTP